MAQSLIHRETTYEKWIKEQGLPVVGGHGIGDILALPRTPWARLGGKGTFIKFEGMEGVTGAYVLEIPPGATLNTEKHLYEEIVYIIQGRGVTEVWNGPREGTRRPQFFEWQTGSLFATPLNTFHRLSNASGSEPAVMLGFTNAPLILDVFHNPDFVFNDSYVFSDRYDGREDYFTLSNRKRDELEPIWLWTTNFVPDVRAAKLDEHEVKGAGLRLTQCEIGDGIMVGHIAEWPVGKYHKAHFHGAGAVLLTTTGVGYSLIWPKEAGTRPYEAGNGDQVIKIDVKEGAVFCPPEGWFHQHFNTGAGPARHLALRYGTRRYGVEFRDIKRNEGVLRDIKLGGTLIEYADEDPEIRRLFAAECAKNGVEAQMP